MRCKLVDRLIVRLRRRGKIDGARSSGPDRSGHGRLLGPGWSSWHHRCWVRTTCWVRTSWLLELAPSMLGRVLQVISLWLDRVPPAAIRQATSLLWPLAAGRSGRRPAAGCWLRACTRDSKAPRVPPAAIRGQRLRAELAGRAGTSGWSCWLVELARSAGRAGRSSWHDLLVGERSAGEAVTRVLARSSQASLGNFVIDI